MKEIINKVIFPYKAIKELEKEIKNQDKQYITLQGKLAREETKLRLYEIENERLENDNTKYLTRLRELRKELKSLKDENKKTRKSS